MRSFARKTEKVNSLPELAGQEETKLKIFAARLAINTIFSNGHLWVTTRRATRLRASHQTIDSMQICGGEGVWAAHPCPI